MYEKGFIINNRTNKKWEFQYNPESFSVGRSVNYSELTSPGNPYPLIQYTGGSSNDVSVSVFTRAENTGSRDLSEVDTRSFGIFLDNLLPVIQSGHANYTTQYKPPTCYVYLGASTLLHFNAVLTGYTLDTDHLSENLIPISAVYKLTFKVIV